MHTSQNGSKMTNQEWLFRVEAAIAEASRIVPIQDVCGNILKRRGHRAVRFAKNDKLLEVAVARRQTLDPDSEEYGLLSDEIFDRQIAHSSVLELVRTLTGRVYF